MRTGVALLLAGAGAILAFAVTTSTPDLNLHTAGYVLILIGIIGMTLPRRAANSAGRRVLVRRDQDQPEEVTFPARIAVRLPTAMRNREPDDARRGTGFTGGSYDEPEDVYSE